MKTFRRVLLWILLLLVSPLFILWIVVAQPTWAANEPSNQKVSPEALEKHVRMLSEDCFPRNYQNLDKLNQAADYIADQFGRAGASVSFQEYSVNGKVYRNVIGSFGTDTDNLFVVGAHYDSHHLTPGADDNASGVAGLIELPHLISQSNLRDENIQLVAYTLEEPPFFDTDYMGSYQHAQSLFDAGVDLTGMIALEMIGYFSDEPGSQSYPASFLRTMYPNKGDFIGVIGTLSHREFTEQIKIGMKGATDLPVYSLNAPKALSGVDYSDHRSYWAFDYDAVMITDTAFYRNPNYHEKTDTADTLDYDRMAKVVVSVFASLNRFLAEEK